MLRGECAWCGEPLFFHPARGWVHQTGGWYSLFCENCGWKGKPYPTLTDCANCGAALEVDYCALPKPQRLI